MVKRFFKAYFIDVDCVRGALEKEIGRTKSFCSVPWKESMLGVHYQRLMKPNKTCASWKEYRALDECLILFAQEIANDENKLCMGKIY